MITMAGEAGAEVASGAVRAERLSTAHPFCVFRHAGNAYAIEAGFVHEVMWIREVAAVPLAPAGVYGLCALRGQALPVIELARVLDVKDPPALPPPGPASPWRGLVVGDEDPLAVFPIERIEAIWSSERVGFKPCADAETRGVLLLGVLEGSSGAVKAGLLDGAELIRRMERLSGR